MKKNYKKPTIHFADFTLFQTIATGCGDNLNLNGATQESKETCGWNVVEGMEIFMDQTICDFAMESFEGPDGVVCYDNPSGGLNIFSS